MDAEGNNDICFTFDSYVCEWKGRNINSLKNKRYFWKNTLWYLIITKIYEAITLYKNKMYLFGDRNQTSPVEASSQISYNYYLSKSVNQMTGEKTLKAVLVKKNVWYVRNLLEKW